MIKKCLFVALVAVLFISGCDTTIRKNDNSLEKNVQTEKPRITASDDPSKPVIQLEYPTKISYPEAKQVVFLIGSFPQVATICKATAALGELSISKLNLSNDHQFTYYFPSTTEPMEVDSLSLIFYDQYGKCISKKGYNIEFLRERKEYRVIARLPE